MTAEFAISIFITGSTMLVFLLPRLYGKFVNHEIINTLMVRCCYIIGFYLMVMNSAIIAEIATTAGYTTHIIFRYMWLWGRMGYLLMFFVFIKTIFDTIELNKQAVMNKRGLD